MTPVSDRSPRADGSPVVVLVAGESSGDHLGASLIAALKIRYPGVSFAGVGGPRMRAQGMECWWDTEQLAVMGLAEVLSHLPRLLRLRKSLEKKILNLAPDIMIGIDSPDFNLGLEKKLKKNGIKTAHYVSPTIWAWRQGRVKKVAEAVDQVFCLFPFEPDFYRNHGVSARYTGHPLADEIPEHSDPAQAQRILGLDPKFRYVALLPGSRRGEVEKLSAPLVGAAKLIFRKYPDIRFLAPMASPAVRRLFESKLHQQPDVPCQVFDGQAREVLASADLVICASGTVTLETLLINRPMVVVYRFNPVSFAIGRGLRLFKARYFSLPNILADRSVVPELLQSEVTAGRIFSEAVAWLEDPQRLEVSRQIFSELHARLRTDAANSAADCVQALLQR